MDTILLIVVAVVIGIYIGWKVHETIMIEMLDKDPELFRELVKNHVEGNEQDVILRMDNGDEINVKGVELEIEQVKGHLYAYIKETNQFVGQAETMEDLMKIAHERHPGKTFFGILPEDVQNS